MSKIVIDKADLPRPGHDKPYNKRGACYPNTRERVYVNGSAVSSDGRHNHEKWYGPNGKLGKKTDNCDVPVQPGGAR